MKEPYGKELILDLHECDVNTFTRESIGAFFDVLCTSIGMKVEDRHFWDDEGLAPEECQTNPKTCGVSAVQFILTSTIVVHSLTKLRKVYINVFSCKDFDQSEALKLAVKWFGSNLYNDTVVVRK